MAQSKEKYKSLDHALGKLRKQVMEDVPFAQEQLPKFSSPEQIFKWLKPRLIYKKDPSGTELFQSLHTLLYDNYYGRSGTGDCDCFSIAALTLMLANGFTNCGIVLTGRKPYAAVHIYTYYDTPQGVRQYLDLTNKYFDVERFYPYKQHIQFKLNPLEKNKMVLELADGRHPYIHLPSQGVQVREDYFDNRLNAGEFQNMLLDEGYQMEEIEELSGKRAERKAAQPSKKAAKKSTKQETKANKPRGQKKAAKIDKKKAKAALIRAKATNKEAGGESESKSVFDKLIDTGGGIIGNFFGGKKVPDDQEREQESARSSSGPSPRSIAPPSGRGKEQRGEYADDEATETVVKINAETGKPQTVKKETTKDVYNFMGMEIPKKVAHIGGGLLLLGGIAYAVKTSKKK